MSLSFHRARAAFEFPRAALAGLLCAALARGVFAADISYQPVVTIGTSANTNVELTSTQPVFAEGYAIDASTLVGASTPRSDLTVLPRLLYQYYPTQKDLDRVEGLLSMSTRYSWQRDRFTMEGFFDHRDDLNVEQPTAEYNPVTPGIGNTAPGTGHIGLGITRNFLILDPTFTHLITPLSSIGVAAEYQRMSYSPSDQSAHIDFNYYLGRVFYVWNLTPRLDATVGAFGSQYEAGSIDSHTTSGGAMFRTSYNWSEVLHSALSLQYQDSKLVETSPKTLSQNSRPWAAEITTVYESTISAYRLDVGRSIGPSAAGGLYTSDQVRGQYDRDLSRRLHFTGAVRLIHDRTIAGLNGNAGRDYTNAMVRLQWHLSPTLFIAGSYTNVWEKYRGETSGADGNVVTLQFGYKGLPRQ